MRCLSIYSSIFLPSSCLSVVFYPSVHLSDPMHNSNYSQLLHWSPHPVLQCCWGLGQEAGWFSMTKVTPSYGVALGMLLNVPGARLSCRHLAESSVSSAHTTGWGLKPRHHRLTPCNPSTFQSPGTIWFCFQNISTVEPSKRVMAVTKFTNLQGMVVKSSA